MTQGPKPLRRRILEAAVIVVLLPVILPIVALVLTLFFAHRALVYLLVWLVWLPQGKDTLLVYSDSPIWRDYMVQEVLPLVQERAVVLNWSERKTWSWWSLSGHVFRTFGGRREFNPLVVMFRPLRRARLFRFWSAFKDWKKGYTEPVTRMRSDLRLSL